MGRRPYRGSFVGIAVVTLIEPFTFRFVLHCGAFLGWFAFLAGAQRWGGQQRSD